MDKIFMNQALFRYRDAVVVSDAAKAETEDTDTLVAAGVLNFMSQGFLPSQELFDAMKRLPGNELTALVGELVGLCQEALGSDVEHAPMYPNYPAQVMEMDQGSLYLNAILHYITDGLWAPEYEKLARPALNEGKERVIGLASEDTLHQIFENLMASNSPLSQEDQSFLNRYLQEAPHPHIPETIPIKETCALVESVLFQAGKLDAVSGLIKTPTDILRFSQAIIGGDFTLRSVIRFGPYTRKVRRFMLSLLNRFKGLASEMQVRKGLWLRFGEVVHPGEAGNRKAFPHTAEAFDLLRSGKAAYSYESAVEAAILAKDMEKLTELLVQRPGVFARRLDHVMRLAETKEQKALVMDGWFKAAPKVSSRVLLQLLQFFKNRDLDFRVFRPAASTNALFIQEGDLPHLDDMMRVQAAAICENALRHQYAERGYMGKVYIDPSMTQIAMPLQQRSAASGFHVLPSYSKLPLDADAQGLRAFLYWENYLDDQGREDRTDLDLSVVLFGEDYNVVGSCAYYSLRCLGCVHSGDFIDAPIGKGASEFVDVDFEEAQQAGARYVLCSVQAYTSVPFDQLETCYAGWMTRKDLTAGEVFEPATVESKFHLTGDRMNICYLVDLEERTVLWLDLHGGQATGLGDAVNNPATRSKMVSSMLRAAVETEPLYLHEVLKLHTDSRGLQVGDKEVADLVFSMDDGITPYNTDELLAYI